jgi:hypothetical protein
VRRNSISIWRTAGSVVWVWKMRYRIIPRSRRIGMDAFARAMRFAICEDTRRVSQAAPATKEREYYVRERCTQPELQEGVDCAQPDLVEERVAEGYPI